MKRTGFIALVLLALVVGVVQAGSLFTDVASHSTPNLVTEINTALDALEDSIDGTTAMASPKVQGTLTAISTNGATTNVIITADGVVDGETIGDDTIDDDSIDWSDVTAADITFAEGDITDATVVSADIKDNTVVAADVANGVFGAAADLYIQYGTCTNGETVAFGTAFGAAPSVCLTYAEDAGADTVCEAVTITTTNFVVQGAAAKNISYIAVGTTP